MERFPFFRRLKAGAPATDSERDAEPRTASDSAASDAVQPQPGASRRARLSFWPRSSQSRDQNAPAPWKDPTLLDRKDFPARMPSWARPSFESEDKYERFVACFVGTPVALVMVRDPELKGRLANHDVSQQKPLTAEQRKKLKKFRKSDALGYLMNA